MFTGLHAQTKDIHSNPSRSQFYQITCLSEHSQAWEIQSTWASNALLLTLEVPGLNLSMETNQPVLCALPQLSQANTGTVPYNRPWPLPLTYLKKLFTCICNPELQAADLCHRMQSWATLRYRPTSAAVSRQTVEPETSWAQNSAKQWLLTYLLTKLSPSWGAVNCVAPQEPPSILWNPKAQYRVHKSPPLVPILSHIDPIHSIPSYLSKIHFNIVHPPTSRGYIYT
jgi:hypothetical protein